MLKHDHAEYTGDEVLLSQAAYAIYCERGWLDARGRLTDKFMEDTDEWAHPSPKFSIEWLKACADAYEVPYPGNIGPDTLCEKILKAMY